MDFLDSNVFGCARHSASELGSALTGSESLNFNSVENVPGFEARAAFTVNSATVFTPVGRGYSVVKEDVDIVPTIIDETLSYVPSVMNIREFFADSLGKQAANVISNALTRDISRHFVT